MVSILARNRVGAIVVADQSNHVLGIISERDIVRTLANQSAAILAEAVSKHMTQPVKTCNENDKIDWVMSEMSQHRFRHMPVVNNNRLCGIISIGDVVKFKIAKAESEAEQMRQYVVAG